MPQELTAAISPAKPEKTKRAWLPEQTELQDAIHNPHREDRDRLIDTLIEGPIEELRKQARKLAGCAASVHLYIDPTNGTVHEHIHRCKSRLCPFCARYRSAHVADEMQNKVDLMTHPRHLVLTVHSRPMDLKSQLRELRNWFTKLRRTPFWKANVSTGVYTMEITVNERTGLWHPHLHILFDGNYLPFKLIQRLWHDLTDGSDIIWIEEVYDRTGAVRELTKYIGKPAKSKHWTDAQLCEYALSTKGERMVQTFGAPTGPTIADEDPNPKPSPDAWHISVSRLVYMAGQDNLNAVHALPLVAARWPHLARYIYGKHPQLEPDMHRVERRLAIMKAIEEGKPPLLHAHPPPKDPAEIERQLAKLLEAIHLDFDLTNKDPAILTEDAD